MQSLTGLMLVIAVLQSYFHQSSRITVFRTGKQLQAIIHHPAPLVQAQSLSNLNIWPLFLEWVELKLKERASHTGKSLDSELTFWGPGLT